MHVQVIQYIGAGGNNALEGFTLDNCDIGIWLESKIYDLIYL